MPLKTQIAHVTHFLYRIPQDKFFLNRRRHLLKGASAPSSRDHSEDETNTSKSETDPEADSDHQ